MADDGVPARVGETWVERVPGLRERRYERARRFTERRDDAPNGDFYEGGFEEMLERGIVTLEPGYRRVLLRSILSQDAIGMPDSPLFVPDADARAHEACEILALGPGCGRWFDEQGYGEAQRLKAGDFVWVAHTVLDRMSAKGNKCRVWSTLIEFVATRIVFTDG